MEAELEPDLLAQAIRAAAGAPDTLATLLSLVRAMDADGRRRIAAVIDDADRDTARTLLAGVTDPNDRARLLELVPDKLLGAIERAADRFHMRVTSEHTNQHRPRA